MAGRFSVEAVFKAVDRITAPVSRMQNRVGKFTRSAEKNFRKLDKAANSFVSGMKKGAVAITAASVIIGAGLVNVVAAGSDFEQAITNVGAVSLKTRAEIAPLEQMALQLGRTTKFTSTQAANAMEVLSRAGFSVQDVLSATPAVLSAAAASGLEIAEVADHVSNALKGMGLATTDAARVADVLALASSKTNSSIGSLGESLRNVASTARQLKVPIEDTVAAVALLQDVGLDASVAGSAFNTMLTKMAAPTAGMQSKMRRLGVSFKDAKGDMLPLQDVLGQLNKASARVGGNFDKVAFLAELVGLRGQKAAANLGKLFETGKLEKLTKQLEKAKGSAKAMADLRMNTFQGSMLLLGSAVDAVKVKIFGMNEGPLKDVVDRMTKWVGINEDLIAGRIGRFLSMMVNNMAAIVKWGKRIGIALGVLFALILALKTFIVVMTAVNLVMALNPIGLIIIGISLLIASIVAAIFWWDELKAAFMNMSAPAKALALLVTGPIGVFVAAAGFLMAAWEPVKTFFVDLWAGISSAFNNLPGPIKTALKLLATTPGILGGGAAGIAASIFGSDEADEGTGADGQGRPVSQLVTPEERIARSVEETRTTSAAEVTIRDESGRAEVTGGKLGPGLSLLQTGAF